MSRASPRVWLESAATRPSPPRFALSRKRAELQVARATAFGLAVACALIGRAEAAPFEDTTRQRVLACTGCHGREGRAAADGYYPRIAGKPAGYLFNQLRNFRDGSRHYELMNELLALIDDDFLHEIANHFAAIETDLGTDHPLGINLVGQPALKSFLAPVAKVLENSGAGLLAVKEEAGSDIDPLAKLGVPNFSPIQDSRFYFNYHHTAADTLDKIVPRELAETAAINAVLAYALANLEQPLPR